MPRRDLGSFERDGRKRVSRDAGPDDEWLANYGQRTLLDTSARALDWAFSLGGWLTASIAWRSMTVERFCPLWVHVSTDGGGAVAGFEQALAAIRGWCAPGPAP